MARLAGRSYVSSSNTTRSTWSSRVSTRFLTLARTSARFTGSTTNMKPVPSGKKMSEPSQVAGSNARRSATGLEQQGWKDSWDSTRFRDGRLAESPIALCEVQGYVYAALVARSHCATEAGDHALATALSEEHPALHFFSVNEPNYGKALRQGILRARGDVVICDEIDLCDMDFYRGALPALLSAEADMVVGSKAMPGAHDNRPAFRRVATRVINGMLRVAVDFRGTDTHGLKAFRREPLVDVVHQCVVDRDIFASELVVRAGRAGLAVIEIPVEVNEKRRPAISLIRRVPGVMKNMVRLTYAIRIKG